MTTTAPRQTDWFIYFPNDYRWSAALNLALAACPHGGSDMGEIERIGRQLKDKVGDDDAWFEAWCAEADRLRERAIKAEGEGNRVTAATYYAHACVYYQVGERFRTPKDAAALDAYRKSVECFHRYAALTSRAKIEVVEVPFEGKSLPAYFVHAENTSLERTPCVVFFDGLDITKEMQYFLGVPSLVERGVACLVVDGPGNGESIRFRELPLRYDYDRAGSAAIDYLETRADVDAKRIGVLAISLGGYYAPRCASIEHRFSACVAWGAIWDYHAVWKKRVEQGFKTQLSVPGHHISWVFGVDTIDQALEKLENFRLDGVVQQMRCPFLLVHGENDAQIPLADAQALYDAVGSEDKTFRIVTAEEGGAQHCQTDYITIANEIIFDWLAKKL